MKSITKAMRNGYELPVIDTNEGKQTRIYIATRLVRYDEDALRGLTGENSMIDFESIVGAKGMFRNVKKPRGIGIVYFDKGHGVASFHAEEQGRAMEGVDIFIIDCDGALVVMPNDSSTSEVRLETYRRIESLYQPVVRDDIKGLTLQLRKVMGEKS